jgi:predicted alpha-1,2-mannosidase
MVQVGPDTRTDGSWDGCSGYHYSDSIIYGFSHTHLSGTGCSDFGDVMIMPMAGKASFDPRVYSSKFKHEKELAKAGFYSVHLDDEDIDVELTSTARVGLHKYTFNKAGTYQIILDLTHRDKLLAGEIKIVDGKTVTGFRRSEAWAKDQRVFYQIAFSKPFNEKLFNGTEGINETGAAFEFKVKKGESIYVKVAISSVDVEGAKKNMLAEMPAFDFEGTRKNAEILWNKELSKIEVKGGTADQEQIFYTALYHCFIHPSIANDVDGRYLGRDFKIYKTDGFNYYSVFSLWDTFRALHPLFNLVQRDRNVDFIKTFMEQYKQVGRMPMWELGSNETDCMIGYHSVSIIADAIAKQNTNFDLKQALEACEGTARNHQYGSQTFDSKGYLSVEDESESVSKSLEYAYNKWCLNQVKMSVADGNDQLKGELHNSYFENLNWQNVFNPKTGFMQPRMNGGWYKPFNAKEVNNNYTEANAWQYSFFVPQDIPGLIEAMGGPTAFEKKLDELFETGSATTGRNQADISGLIGQYAHGNEPSHHMAYLYNFVGKPHKTQERVQQIMKEMYHNAPDGLAGNEDCGQMSAWYVFSAMGFYPVTPGKDEYEIGSPIFNEISIQAKEQTITFNFNRKNAKEIYVKRNSNADVSLQNNHDVITNLTALSNITKGANNAHLKTSFVCSNQPYLYSNVEPKEIYRGILLPSPIIETSSKTFNDSLLVTMYPNFVNEETRDKSKIYYRIIEKDKESLAKTVAYTKPFYIYQSCKIEASSSIDMGENRMDLQAVGSFYKRQNKWTIQLSNEYNKQYTAGGAEGMIDGMYGDKDWRKGGWQGYQPQDFEAIINLGKVQSVSSCYGSFLQDQRSWILLPSRVEFYSSMDGINYTIMGVVKHDIPEDAMPTILQKLNLKLPLPTQAKYIKIRAINYGKLPKWHLSAGEDAFIFVDEVGVE